MKIVYKPSFVRELKSLPQGLQQEAKEKILLLGQDIHHPFLKTHKLKGKLKGWWSFSVNYRDRIIFQFEKSNQEERIALLHIGNHSVYD